MTKTKSTKRALIMSALSLLMCVSMLIGSTYAWFTDSVTSGGNKIIAGTLKVDLIHAHYNGNTGSAIKTSLKDNPDHKIFDYALWEPGYTQIEYFQVINKGNLHFQYELRFTSEGALTALADVIEVYGGYPTAAYGKDRDEALKDMMYLGTIADIMKKGGKIFQGNTGGMTLTEDASMLAYAVALHMKEEAGNEYQGLPLFEGESGFNVTFVATQMENEFDSFGNDYDKFADYDGEISNAVSLEAALTNGGTYKLISDINLDSAVSVPAGVKVNLNLDGKTITSTKTAITNNGTMTIVDGTIKNEVVNCKDSVISNKGTMVLKGVEIVGSPMDSTGYPAYTVSTSGKLTIEEGTTISANRGAISMSNGADLVINGGSFVVSDAADGRGMTLHTIYAYGYDSTLTINDGYFEMGHTSKAGASVICPAGATINIFDGDFRDAMDDTNYQSTGNFQNYMGYGAPINVYGGTYDDTTFKGHVVNGCTYIQNDDGTYTVKSSVEYLEDAFAKGGSVTIPDNMVLTEEVEVPEGSKVELDLNNKTLTGNIAIAEGAELTVKNGTIKNTNSGVSGIQTNGGELILENATIESARHGVRVEGGNVTINGGKYTVNPTSKMTMHALNVSDGGYVIINDGTFVGPKGLAADSGAAVNVQAGSTVIIYGGNFSGGLNDTLASKGTLVVCGGTFDQDPKAYVPAGYIVEKNDDGTYTVSMNEVKDVFKETENGGTVYLPAGEITLPADVNGKTLNITGTKDTVINITTAQGINGANITFDGITVKGTSEDFMGLQHAGTIVYNNVTIDGGMTLYGEKVVYNNCNFTLTNQYIRTYGAKVVEFNNCTFETKGKAILIHQDGSSNDCVVTIKDCTFNATEKATTWDGIHVAAISIDGTIKDAGSFTVNLEGNNTANDVFNGLWQIKANEENVTVNVNGVIAE